jgi:hypothetical protein
MNKMIGFFESYTDGSSPSRIPPCGLARSVLEALAALAVVVTTLVTTSVTVDMAAVYWLCSLPCRLDIGGSQPLSMLVRWQWVSERFIATKSSNVVKQRTKDVL